MDKELKKILEDVYKAKVELENVSKPLIEPQIPKGLHVLNLECSVLFADIRNSTVLSENLKVANMTKVYHMFSKIVAKHVKINHGRVTQFIGDGMMAVFTHNNQMKSGQLAFEAAKGIKLDLDTVFKEVTGEEFHFDCGYGICTGHIYITRLKQKKYKLQSFGVFPGKATNFAAKFCSQAEANECIVDSVTNSQIKDVGFIRKPVFNQEAYSCLLK